MPYALAEVPLSHARGRGLVELGIDEEADKLVAHSMPIGPSKVPYFVIPGCGALSREEMTYIADYLRDKPPERRTPKPDIIKLLLREHEMVMHQRVY